MCGRMVLTRSAKDIAAAFDVAVIDDGLDFAPRFNVAPTQDVLAIRESPADGRRLSSLYWGLVPFWAKEKSIGSRMINARAETAAEKPAFRTALRRRRCIVPADGFYEWLRPPLEPGVKRKPPSIPHFFRAPDSALLPIAGLWEEWTDTATGELLESCTLLTREANADVSPVHHRMPVILGAADVATWLDPEIESVDRLEPLLGPASTGRLVVTRVGTAVNNARHDAPDCIAPVL
jgi:putative SOS response-associated peptidase YedK